MRAFCRFVIFPCAWIALVSCGGERVPSSSSGDSTGLVVPPVEGEVTEPLSRSWDAAVGKVMVLVDEAFPDSVLVIGPDYVEGGYSDSSVFDLRALSNVRIDLFSRSQFRGTIEVAGRVYRRIPEGCTGWPVLGVVGARSPGWTVGLESGRATVIRLDSIDGMALADSLQFARQIISLASGIPETQDPTFNTIPFLLLRGYRFHTGLIDGVVGVVQRTIPSEANPREERVLFIAERPVGSTSDFQVAYVDRAVSDSEAPRSVDLLAAVKLVDGQRPMLIFNYMYNDGGTTGFVERVAPKRWSATWESAYVGC